MAAPLTPYEQLALDAYNWAKKSQYRIYEGLIPRSYQRLVDAYCSATGKTILPWNKGNSGRNLSTIITGLEKHGLKLSESGHITFLPSASDDTVAKAPQTAAKPAATTPSTHASTTTITSPVQKSASAVAYQTAAKPAHPTVQKAASTMAPTSPAKAAATAAYSPLKSALQSSQASLEKTRLELAAAVAKSAAAHSQIAAEAARLEKSRAAAVDALQRDADRRKEEKAEAKRAAKREKDRRREEERAQARARAAEQMRLMEQRARAVTEKLQNNGSSAPGGQKAEQKDRDAIELQEEEEFLRAVQLSLEENEREKAMDELIRAQLLSASAPPATHQNNGKNNASNRNGSGADSDTGPPMLKKRSSSGRMRAAAHPANSSSSSNNRSSTNQSSTLNDKVEKAPNMAVCPVCDSQLPLAQIDSHLDTCLSEKAVEEISRQDLTSSTTPASSTGSKKRSNPTDPILLEGIPAPKRNAIADYFSAPPTNAMDADDCLIVGGPFPPKITQSFYYSDPEESEEEHPDDEDHIEFAARNKWLEDGGSEQEEDDEDEEDEDDMHPKALTKAAHERYLQSVQFASKLGQLPKLQHAPPPADQKPAVPTKTTSAAAPPAKAAPPAQPAPSPAPPRPKLVIPNSGGMFSEVEFKTANPGKECPICLEDFECGDVGVMLPCLCLYHPKCITSWLERKPKNCPSHGDY